MFHKPHNETDIHIRYMADYNTAGVYEWGGGGGGGGGEVSTRPVGKNWYILCHRWKHWPVYVSQFFLSFRRITKLFLKKSGRGDPHLSHFNVQTFKAFIETKKLYFDASLSIFNLYLLIILQLNYLFGVRHVSTRWALVPFEANPV
jgi:hypothetical protein